MIELVISAMILVTVISFVTSLLYRIDGVWSDCADQRAAMCELSNQLERLTLLSPDQLSDAIESLEPSPTVARTLHEPVLNAQLITDEFGPRLVLQIDWQRRYPGRPVEMVAWIPQSHDNATEAP